MESAGVEVTDQAVKETAVADEDVEAIFMGLVVLVGNKGEVRDHGELYPRM